MNLSSAVVRGLVGAAFAYVLVYWAGLAWSRGYHKGKREFVARMVCDAVGTDATKEKVRDHGEV